MKLFRRYLAILLSFTLFFAVIGQTQAAMVSNSQLINQIQQANDSNTLLQTIRRTDVQAQLHSLGVSSADIESRINQMTPAEIAQLNQQMHQLPAGSGILSLAVFVFLVFVFTDAIGATDIFPFVHAVR